MFNKSLWKLTNTNYTPRNLERIVETKSEKQDGEEAIGAFSFVFVFHVDNIEELTKLEEDNTVTISPALGNALAAITYSTSRGILMTRFQGTALNNFILPVINPNKLIE